MGIEEGLSYGSTYQKIIHRLRRLTQIKKQTFKICMIAAILSGGNKEHSNGKLLNLEIIFEH